MPIYQYTVSFVIGVNYSGTENITHYMQAIQTFASASGCGNCTATLNLTVTCDSCIVDVVVLTQASRRLLSEHRGYKTDVTSYSSGTAKQIQDKINGTAGPQAIANSMGLSAADVTVESPPQVIIVQVNAPAPPPAPPPPSPPASPASGPNVGVIVGAVVGSLVGVGGLIGLFYWLFAILPNTNKKGEKDSKEVGGRKESQFPNRRLRLLGRKMILKEHAPRGANHGHDPRLSAGLVYRV